MTAIAHTPVPETALTRRELLAACGAAMAAFAVAEVGHLGELSSVLGDASGPAQLPGDASVPIHLRRASFGPLVGDRFELHAATGQTVARLVAVDDLGAPWRSGTAARDDAFALVFHASGGPRLEQDVMTLVHPRIGRFQLLTAPSSHGHRGQDYSAVINRASPGEPSGGTRGRPASLVPARHPLRRSA